MLPRGRHRQHDGVITAAELWAVSYTVAGIAAVAAAAGTIILRLLAARSVATSLTVVVTECQAEFLTWFLTYASLKYTLESFHDYTPSSNVKADPNCANVTAAKGVNLKDVMAAYPQLF